MTGMSTMGQRIGERWVTTVKGRQYRLPYAECPHCGKYDFTTKTIPGGLFRSSTERNVCENCGYREEVTEE